MGRGQRASRGLGTTRKKASRAMRVRIDNNFRLNEPRRRSKLPPRARRIRRGTKILRKNSPISAPSILLILTSHLSVRLPVSVINTDNILQAHPAAVFQMKNPGVYQASTNSLTVELQSQLIDVMKLAEQKEAEVGPIQI